MAKLHDDEHMIFNLWNADIYGNGEWHGAVLSAYPEDENGSVDHDRGLWSVSVTHRVNMEEIDNAWLSAEELPASLRELLDDMGLRVVSSEDRKGVAA